MCHSVAVTMSDMKTVQKIQKDKIYNENLILQWQTEKPKKWQKMAKFHKIAKWIFSWPAQF